MQDHANALNNHTRTILGRAFAIGLLIFFGPLLVAWCEHLCLGTRHFEEALEFLGVHSLFGEIYRRSGIYPAISRLIP